jgi:hypothetical protein
MKPVELWRVVPVSYSERAFTESVRRTFKEKRERGAGAGLFLLAVGYNRFLLPFIDFPSQHYSSIHSGAWIFRKNRVIQQN